MAEMTAPPGRHPGLAILVAATAYFFLNAATQGLVSPTADLDQAQQLVLSQDLQWGYGAQPPLYTWIVHLLFSLTGPKLWVLLGLKAALLSLLILGAIRVGQRLGLEEARLGLAVLGFACIPQLAWEAQRDLTHSVLATVMAMWSLWAVLALRQSPSPRNYLLFGLLIGLGVVSKYNYAFFLLALLLAGLASPEYRARLLHPRMLLALLVALVVLSPHVGWVWMHPELAASSTHKLARVDAFTLAGVGKLAVAVLAFMAPLLLVAGVSWDRRAEPRPVGEGARLLLWLFVIVLILMLVFVLASGATHVKDRWLQPVLFFAPLLLVALLSLKARVFTTFALAILLLVALLLPGRTLLAQWSDKVSRPNLPYAAVAAELRGELGKPPLIVSDKELLAGNMRLSFPTSRVEVVRRPEELTAVLARGAGEGVLFLTENPEKGEFMAILAAHAGLPALVPRRIERPLSFVQGKTLSIYWVRI